MAKIESQILCLVVLVSFTSCVTSMDIPGLNIVSNLGGHGLSHITSLLNGLTVDHLPHLNEIQKISSESCINLGRNLAQKILPAYLTCTRKLRTNDGSIFPIGNRRNRDPCFGKCVGTELKTLDPDGSPNIESTKKFLNEVLPEKYDKYVKTVFEKCEYELLLVDTDDKKCESYHTAYKCIFGALSEVVEEAIQMCPDIPDLWKHLISSVTMRILHRFT